MQAIVSKAAVGEEKFKVADHLSQETALVVHGTVRADSRAAGGYEPMSAIEDLGHRRTTPSPQGARRLPPRPSASVAPVGAPACDTPRPPRGRERRSRLSERSVRAGRYPIFHADVVRRHHDAVSRELLRGSGRSFSRRRVSSTTKPRPWRLGVVHCFGPVFRAEKSKTRRHLTEFWMVEPEMAYATLDDVIALGEELVVSVVGRVLTAASASCRRSRETPRRWKASRRHFRARPTTRPWTLLREKGQTFEWEEISEAPTKRSSRRTSTGRSRSIDTRLP